MPVRIFPPADDRLIEIWNYTLDQWDEAQADLYVRSLVEFIESLSGQRPLWRGVMNLRGVWYVRHEHHFVFFRELSGGVIGVITILHENMDLPARLKEDRKHIKGA